MNEFKFEISLLDFDNEQYKNIIEQIKKEKSEKTLNKSYNCYYIDKKIDAYDKFVIFNEQIFALKNIDFQDEKYRKNVFYFTKDINIFNNIVSKNKIIDKNIYDRKNPKCGYKVGFNNNIFICFSEISTDTNLNSQNVFKILFLQIICISYKSLLQNYSLDLKNINNISTDLVLDLRRKYLQYKINLDIYKNTTGEEFYAIYDMVLCNFKFKDSFNQISKTFNELFEIKTLEENKKMSSRVNIFTYIVGVSTIFSFIIAIISFIN